MNPTPLVCPRSRMVSYSTGEVANSLIGNSITGFAMLFYTEALGLSPKLAGLAMAIAVFWDAISDPLMGHITDNTRSRFGRRHPYILLGGLLVILIYVFLWYVPEFVRGSPTLLFWYLLGINLLQRTGITIFGVPYVALGFELCADYDGRVSLQGIRSAMNMLTNLLGIALSWTLFFRHNEGVRATAVPDNYLHMALCFAVVSVLSILYVVYATRGNIVDSRQLPRHRNGLRDFLQDMKEIVMDFYPRYVFAFTVVVMVGITLVASLQMYLYEHFMQFGGVEKTIVHGGSMVCFGLGSLLSGGLTRRFEKKGTVYLAAVISICGSFSLAAVLLTRTVVPEQAMLVGGVTVPVAVIVFVLLHGTYWVGNGIMFPTTTSMMADVAEINELRTGRNKDGAYAAVFSFSQKVAISVGLLISGMVLTLIGFRTGVGLTQAPATVWKLCGATLLAGPLVSLLALLLIRYYPVTKALLQQMRTGARPKA
ncbi:MAG: MFS transporter [Cephaloticoccus sp.]|nr:MFS transporter [Cephaloticoccus sp.]MCF7759984.1 MFS transporter [Cephaloticoccus sp.]